MKISELTKLMAMCAFCIAIIVTQPAAAQDNSTGGGTYGGTTTEHQHDDGTDWGWLGLLGLAGLLGLRRKNDGVVDNTRRL
ncbi:MAG TPA: WGxxGxxG family protein [Patescibacteria group bacterium]|nr:WGxxGxxG family protein [Patescibacteria group bacterium]